jgi:hypothetical protein
MGSVAKISVSLNPEDAAWAKAKARQQARSLSAVVSEALLRQRQAEAGIRLLDELGTGDISKSDVEAIRAELGWGKKRRKPNRPTRRSKR